MSVELMALKSLSDEIVGAMKLEILFRLQNNQGVIVVRSNTQIGERYCWPTNRDN
jgi:hypothetical protein